MKIKKIEQTTEDSKKVEKANGLRLKTRVKAGPADVCVDVCG